MWWVKPSGLQWGSQYWCNKSVTHIVSPKFSERTQMLCHRILQNLCNMHGASQRVEVIILSLIALWTRCYFLHRHIISESHYITIASANFDFYVRKSISFCFTVLQRVLQNSAHPAYSPDNIPVLGFIVASVQRYVLEQLWEGNIIWLVSCSFEHKPPLQIGKRGLHWARAWANKSGNCHL